MTSELAQGKRFFETGYYRKALHVLLPLAVEGNIQSQYAVGYLYYYGYGMPQDTETGSFWIERAASKGYLPAIEALKLIETNQSSKY